MKNSEIGNAKEKLALGAWRAIGNRLEYIVGGWFSNPTLMKLTSKWRSGRIGQFKCTIVDGVNNLVLSVWARACWRPVINRFITDLVVGLDIRFFQPLKPARHLNSFVKASFFSQKSAIKEDCNSAYLLEAFLPPGSLVLNVFFPQKKAIFFNDVFIVKQNKLFQQLILKHKSWISN